MVGVAVNVTLFPEQTAPLGFAAIFKLAGKFGFTVIVTVFDVAGDPVAHVLLEVSTQVIASLLAKVDDVKAEFVSPLIFVPLFFH